MKKCEKTAVLSALLLSFGASVQANTTYDWTGGAAGYTGTIVLDSSSSSGGSVADIVSLVISTPTTGGTLDVNLASAYLADPIFTWNSSQITEMGVWENVEFTAEGPGSFEVAVEENYMGLLNDNLLESASDNGGYVYSYGYYPGSWVAATTAVPDGGSSVWLLGLALVGLGSLKRFSSTRITNAFSGGLR
jgi:hypothetical protein